MLKSLHNDVSGVRVVAANTDTATSGAASAEVAPVISTEDESVAVRVGQVLRQGSGLVDIVPV